MIKYSVATQWDTENLINILSVFNEENQVSDIYGAMTFTPIGHGRSPYSIPNVDFEKAKLHIEAVQSRGITFNYLLNGNFDPEKLNDPEFKKEVLDYLDLVFNGLNIDFVTIAVPELVKLVNEHYPDVFIKLSTIHNILSVRDIQKLEHLTFHKVTVGNDAPRNTVQLKELVTYLGEKGIDVEMMISETCLFKCPTRQIHYRKQTNKNADYSTDWYMNNCTSYRITHPEEIFKASWVRPEDLDYYESISIKNFKISGRSKSVEWTRRCLKAYINRQHTGNLMEILGTTPPDFKDNSDHLFYIDNQHLNNFLSNHPKNCYELECDTCNYCKKVALDLFKKGAFTINEICGEYVVRDEEFVFKPGGYIKSLNELVLQEKGL